jgi:mannose-6-phosphate isomerase-like protein (cupin superfamily)
MMRPVVTSAAMSVLLLTGGTFDAESVQEDGVLRPVVKTLATTKDYTAPDGSEVRLLAAGTRGGLAHGLLPAGTTSHAHVHKTVDEIWYFLGGTGEVWLQTGTEEQIVETYPGVSLLIPRGTAFQFRSTGSEPLLFLVATMPPWPAKEEASPLRGMWAPTNTVSDKGASHESPAMEGTQRIGNDSHEPSQKHFVRGATPLRQFVLGPGDQASSSVGRLRVIGMVAGRRGETMGPHL